MSGLHVSQHAWCAAMYDVFSIGCPQFHSSLHADHEGIVNQPTEKKITLSLFHEDVWFRQVIMELNGKKFDGFRCAFVWNMQKKKDTKMISEADHATTHEYILFWH